MKEFLRLGEKIFRLTVQNNDLSGYGIIVPHGGGLKAPPETPAPVYKAAEVLQSYLCKLTDIVLPILLCTNPLRPAHTFAFETEGYAEEEYRVRVHGGNVTFGGGARGILYGVYSFLENHCGVRFFAKDIERVLNVPEIRIDETDERNAPLFEYRELCDWTAWNPDFSVKSGLNGNFVRKLRAEDGGAVGFAGGFAGLVHTFSHLVPPDVYYRSEPELYAFSDGIRNPEGLCLSNKKTLDVAYAAAMRWLRAEENPTLISVSINDGNVPYCRCEKCRARIESGENDTDLLLDFVNRMQRRIRKTYPNVSVETISYCGVNAPPVKVKPDPGVIVRVCGSSVRGIPLSRVRERYERDKDERLADTARFCDRIEEFAKITDKTYVWDYPYNYHVINAPFPVLHTLREDMRYYAEHNVKGVYINGETDTCDFTELKVYLLSKLLFDPLMTEEEYERLIDEFLRGYYGDGAPFVREYIALCEKAANPYFGCTDEPQNIIPCRREDGSPDTGFISQARELWRKAFSAAKTDGERRRVRKTALQVEYYDLYCMHEYVMSHGDGEQKADYVCRNGELYRDMANFGITRVVENSFLPVVTDFRQSPRETIYWDAECAASDRNNENYARALYLLLPLKDQKGVRADISVLCRTNNENAEGILGVWNGSEFAENGVAPAWKIGNDYERVNLGGGVVTDVYEFAEQSGLPLGGLELCLMPRHLAGLIVRVRKIDAGAYISLKDPKHRE